MPRLVEPLSSKQKPRVPSPPHPTPLILGWGMLLCSSSAWLWRCQNLWVLSSWILNLFILRHPHIRVLSLSCCCPLRILDDTDSRTPTVGTQNVCSKMRAHRNPKHPGLAFLRLLEMDSLGFGEAGGKGSPPPFSLGDETSLEKGLPGLALL